MISIFGEVYFRNENGSDRADGFGYRVACELSERGAFPAFMTGLGADDRGRYVVEQMVEDEVMFDPDLALLPFPTAGWGEEIEKTALANVPQDLLREGTSMHSNLNVGYFTSPVLYYSPSREGFLEEMRLCPIPVLQILEGLTLDDGTFEKAQSYARFIMTDKEDERINKEYVIFKEGRAEFRKDGKVLAEASFTDKVVFVSDLLEALDTEDNDADIEGMIVSFMEKRA